MRLRHGVGGGGRAAALGEELDEAVGCLGVARRAAQREPAFGAGGGHGDRPAGADLAQHLVLGDLDVVEEDLGEAGLAVDLGDGAHGDAGRVHGDEEVGQAAVALGLGVGAEDAEAPFGEGAPAGPRLLPVEHPAVAGRVARAAASGCRPGRCRRRARTSPGTRSRRRDAMGGQVARLLGLGPVLEHGGGEQEDAVLAHPLGRAGTVVLLLEHEPLEDPEVAPAVLDRPADDGPAVLEHGALPGPVGLEAGGRIERGEGLGGDVRGQPGPGLGAEGLVLGAEGQVHGAANLAQRPAPCQGGVPAQLLVMRLMEDERPHEEVHDEPDDRRLRTGTLRPCRTRAHPASPGPAGAARRSPRGPRPAPGTAGGRRSRRRWSRG